MVLHLENPKDVTRKVVGQINELGQDTGYKINEQKSLALLYSNKEISESEIKENIPLALTIKRIKH